MHSLVRRLLVLLSLVAAAAPATAQEASSPSRPRIGLVLGGGGAKGFAHVGVLQVLEENRIPVDVVAGTSMGAVVGSLYASGQDAVQITGVVHAIDWKNLFADNIPRRRLTFRRRNDQRDVLIDYRISFDDHGLVLPKGVLRGQDLFLVLAQQLAAARSVVDFDHLALPFRAVATDIVTGEPVVMGDGDIATAVFASMAVPAGLPPVERDGRLLVDGMLVDNVPVDVARRMGAQRLIVVDVSATLRSRDQITSFVSVIDQMQRMLGRESIDKALQSLSPADVLIQPDISTISATSFELSDEGIALGRAAATAALDRLKAYQLSPEAWAAYLAERTARKPHYAPVLQFVALENSSSIPDRQIKAKIEQKVGQPLDAAMMTRDLSDIYALGGFRSVRYRVGARPGHPDVEGVTVTAEGDPSTDNWVQFGLGITTDFNRTSDLILGLSYTRRNLFGTSTEWRSDLRFGTNLLAETNLYREFGTWFTEAGPYWRRNNSALYVDKTHLAEIRNERVGFHADTGLLLGHTSELRLRADYARVNLSTQVGEPIVDGHGLTDASVSLIYTHDSLNEIFYPRRGWLARVNGTHHMAGLGDFGYSTISGRVVRPLALSDSNTLILAGDFGFTLEGDGPVLGDFTLGGFLNLSGTQPTQFVGRHMLIGRAIFLHRLGAQAPIFDLPLYVGGSVEVGNSWYSTSEIGFGDLRPAASLFASAHSPIGPVTLAFGQARGGRALYFIIGRIF